MLESTTFGNLLDVSGVRERGESMIQRFLAQASVFRRWLIYRRLGMKHICRKGWWW